MIQRILCTVLILISLSGRLYAQSEFSSYATKNVSRSKTEQSFNAWHGMINVRDFVTLKEGRLILELLDGEDYNDFANMDSILQSFMKDIAFLKDSLEGDPTGHLRLDYVLSPGYKFKKIRFKKYPSDGAVFINQSGEISRLKMEQDTVRILIQKSRTGIPYRVEQPCSIPYTIQATFLVDNYTDINKIVAYHILNGAIDTMKKVSLARKQGIYQNQPISIVYNPYYNGQASMRRYDRLVSNEYDVIGNKHMKWQFTVNGSIGVGVIRSTLAPMADIGMQLTKMLGREDSKNRDYMRLSVSPYYFFEKDSHGDYLTHDNWFVNAILGSIYDWNESSWFSRKFALGAGYLFAEKGGYFKNTTIKLFTELEVRKGLNIVPEFIFSDNFRQIFPGVTVKVF